MRVICTGNNSYNIYDDSLQVFNNLPVQTFIVRFNKDVGFFLEKYTDMEVNEKVYGVHDEKVKKVLSAYASMERNLGVILSGDKGIGKSLFARMLSREAINRGIPVVVIDTFYPMIASYIESIDQDVMVLFDEFDKTFGEVRSKDGEASPQTNLLSLFDGVSGGHKLFVVTCNELRSLNSYLINRPGRFHYHMRFDYPTGKEITEYLKDKISEEYYGEIDRVIDFSNKVDLNYDCLRAIAFELNTGLSFADAIKDLNILNLSEEQYDLTLIFENGLRATSRGVSLDMFSSNPCESTAYMYYKGYNCVDITFITSNARFDLDKYAHIIQGSQIGLNFMGVDDYDSDDFKQALAALKNTKPVELLIKRQNKRGLHYLV